MGPLKGAGNSCTKSLTKKKQRRAEQPFTFTKVAITFIDGASPRATAAAAETKKLPTHKLQVYHN